MSCFSLSLCLALSLRLSPCVSPPLSYSTSLPVNVSPRICVSISLALSATGRRQSPFSNVTPLAHHSFPHTPASPTRVTCRQNDVTPLLASSPADLTTSRLHSFLAARAHKSLPTRQRRQKGGTSQYKGLRAKRGGIVTEVSTKRGV